jgi:pimeloyl-ACP methyl ester carboxylesterase
MEFIKISNSKGKSLAVVAHRPSGQTGNIAILCPGYLDTKDYPHLVHLAELLCSRRYVAVRFDPTGTWESEGDISEYLTSQYLDDIESVLEYFLQDANYTNILLVGHSRGGQVSMLYSARDTRISQVVGIMPSHGTYEGPSREEWQRLGFKDSERDDPKNNNQRYFRVPFQHVLDRDQFDEFNNVKEIQIPITFIAGELDDVIPSEYVKELYDAANEPKTLVLAEGVDHDYRLNIKDIEMINNLVLGVIRE